MNPGISPRKSDALDQIRKQLEANLTGPNVVREPTTPPNSPRPTRPSSPRDSVATRRTSDSAPRPVHRGSVSSGSTVMGLQMAQMSKSKVPAAPPLPPSLASSSAPQRRAPPTPAQILALPANASKSIAEKMKLFAGASAHATIDTMAQDPKYQAIFTALAADAPQNLKDVLHQMVAVERLRANTDVIAQRIGVSIPSGEMAAGRHAGYQVHPHTYAGGDAPARATRLQQQFTRDAGTIKATFDAAHGADDHAAFYRAFTPRGDASCHAVRMNGIMGALENLSREEDDPFDGSRADTSSEVLQAAYQLAVERGEANETNVRAALNARNVPAGRIDTIVTALRDASLID